MATTRRRPRVVWLPPDPNLRVGHNPATNANQTGAFDFTLSPAGPITTGDLFTAPPIAMVSDLPGPQFNVGGTGTLSDIENSAYRLRRIVGKIFCSMGQSPTGSAADSSGILITAGFIVLRVDIAGVPLGAAASSNAYSPGAISGWGDPWIWRRSWRLSNFTSAILKGSRAAFPETNIENGPAAVDGPHVDQKTARIVGPEERLFFVIGAVATDSGTNPWTLSVQGEIRCLGSMRVASGNRRNASR